MTIRVGLPTVMALLLSTASAPAETRGTVASRRARPGDGELNSTAGAFRKLLDRYPESGKVPDGLLKIGYTHYELKQWNEARAALEQVQADFPDTTLARLAENRLRSMKMEGHY